MKVIFDPENDMRRGVDRDLPRIDVFSYRVLAKHRNMTGVKDRAIYADKLAERARRQMATRRIPLSEVRRINREQMERLAAERDAYGEPTWRALAAAAVIEAGLPCSWQDIMRKNRKREIGEARQRAMCAVSCGKPQLSMSHVAKLFGCSSHVTVFNAVQKYGAKR